MVSWILDVRLPSALGRPLAPPVLRAAGFLAAGFFAEVLRAVVFLTPAFLAAGLRVVLAVGFVAVDLRAEDFLLVVVPIFTSRPSRNACRSLRLSNCMVTGISLPILCNSYKSYVRSDAS